jgi:hypothetical protein
MSKWSRLKVALLTAVATLSALNWGSCLLGDSWWPRMQQYVTIANLFD